MGPKEYKTPADLNGVVVRTPGADPYSRSIEALEIHFNDRHAVVNQLFLEVGLCCDNFLGAVICAGEEADGLRV